MIAVFINCAAVIAGSLVGLLFRSRLAGRQGDVIPVAAGAVTLVLGVQMALGYGNVVYLALSVILGGIVGFWIDIDRRILSLGGILEKVTARGGALFHSGSAGADNFPRAFLNGSVLFCVGAMTIVGSLDAGLRGDYRVILTKSVLDGFMAIGFAAAMGAGTLFSALAILVYQGGLTLGAGAISRIVSDRMLSELSASGGVLILMIGVNLLGLRQIKTANYLPAMLFSLVFVLLDPLLQGIFGGNP
jgi:uncharacterized membrane protein YqgA involved in biofilm formation